MKHPMIPSVISALILSACAGSSPKDQLTSPENQAVYGTRAYELGDYETALNSLWPAVKDAPTKAQREAWLSIIASIYWETGNDWKLLELVDRGILTIDQGAEWWCLIAERRGHFQSAAECYDAQGDNQRYARARRAKAIHETLAPTQSPGIRSLPSSE
jgi:tetratricopeptide (TPR) repeat protein